jgi:hypothetical protein
MKKISLVLLMTAVASTAAQAGETEGLELFTCKGDYVNYDIGWFKKTKALERKNEVFTITRQMKGRLDIELTRLPQDVSGGLVDLNVKSIKKFGTREIKIENKNWYRSSFFMDVAAGRGEYEVKGKRSDWDMHKSHEVLKLYDCVANLPNIEIVAREISAE